MRKFGVLPIHFKPGADGNPIPRDPSLYARAVQYCEENLAEVPDMGRFHKTYVECEFGENGELLNICGIACYCFRPDITVFRVTGPYAVRATNDLYERLNSHFSDEGWRGQEVLIHISGKESPEQRCDKWQESLAAIEAKPADRFLVTVR